VIIEVKRLWCGPDTPEFRASTTGVLILDGVQSAFTLEPSALMIPPGTYAVKLLWSARFNRRTPHLDVPDRTEIEIHGGNRATDSDGCVLVALYRVSDYLIYDSLPATSKIELGLMLAENAGEDCSVVIS
jgi:hypothetical protein